ncbi:MAG: integration host factor subunit alpha [Candidatus Dadabacteria bacterium]|nr:integration host factor subunit alpha [Candidatus Dadabacteria bacterium]
MTKKELGEVLHSKIGLSKRESSEIVESFFNNLKDILSNGQSIKLPRFGSFRTRNRNARKGRNPSTGEDITIGERKVVVFKSSRFLRDALNSE